MFPDEVSTSQNFTFKLFKMVAFAPAIKEIAELTITSFFLRLRHLIIISKALVPLEQTAANLLWQ